MPVPGAALSESVIPAIPFDVSGAAADGALAESPPVLLASLVFAHAVAKNASAVRVQVVVRTAPRCLK
jgi:hypothetical protein